MVFRDTGIQRHLPKEMQDAFKKSNDILGISECKCSCFFLGEYLFKMLRF